MKAFTPKYYQWLPLLLLCAFYFIRVIHFPVHDFANYYFGGYFLSHEHFTSDIYFPYCFNKEITALGNPHLFAGFAPNSPFLALLFIPFSFLSLAAAKLAFNGISILLFIYTLGRLTSFYKVNPLYILLIPVLFIVPIKNDILFGQVYLLLFFFLSESWLAYEKKHFVKTGLLLSLAILLKVFPMLLLLVFLFRKQFRLFFYTLISCLLLILVTIPFCGLEVWFFYITQVLTKASSGGIASAYVDNYQSVFMFLKQLLVFDASQNNSAPFNQPILFAALLIGFKAALLTIGFYITNKANSLSVLSYWILAMILISPYGSTYTFILMLFPFVAVAKSGLPISKKIVFLALMFLVNNLPLSLFIENGFPLSYLRLFFLAAFFMAMLSLAFRYINWKITASVSFVVILFGLIWNRDNVIASAYLLKDDGPLLIHDYSIANNRLTYFYWDGNGENKQTLEYRSVVMVPLQLKKNRIYLHGKPIASDSGNKLKPMLIDNRTVVYLSDYDRGIGFYTLRKIDIK